MENRNISGIIDKLKKLDEENLKIIDIGTKFLLLSQDTKKQNTTELEYHK